MPAIVLGCLAAAALSLLGPHEPTYDPWSWLVWGREIVHLDLVTTAGPSWKPLPVLFTTPFALLGDAVGPALWLIVARAGGLLAIVLGYRLAARLAGPVAGAIAAAGLVLQDRFISYFARGNSEGLLVALCLWAVERHLDGHRRHAFGLAVAAGLLRPELWAFVALYGLWLVLDDRRCLVLVSGAAAAIAVLWFIPEKLGSGDFLRGASRAREPVADSPAQAAHPFLAVFDNAAPALSAPVYLGAVIAVLFAIRAPRHDRRRSVTLALAAAAAALMVIVACLAQAGFTGNLRYVTLPAALVCVLAGVGWAELLAAARERFGAGAGAGLAALAMAFAAPFVVADVSRLADQLDGVGSEGRLLGAVPAVIARAGGKAAVMRCGTVYSTGPNTPVVAWHLGVHLRQVALHPRPPGTIVAPRASAISRDPRFAPLGAAKGWVVRSSCARRAR